MRIAFISDHASPLAPADPIAGGEDASVPEVSRQLVALGHEVDVFARRDDPSIASEATIDGVGIIHVDAGPPRALEPGALLPWIEPFAASVERRARRRRYDVVQTALGMSAIAGRHLQRSLGTSLIVRCPSHGGIRRHQALAGADHIVTECRQVRNELVAHHVADPARISVVPTGFEQRELFPGSRYAARRRIGIPLGGPLIVHVGSFAPRAGAGDAIRGASAFLSRRRHARMILVGGYPDDPASTVERGRLEQLARELEVWRQVAFAGSVPLDRRRAFYVAADIVVTTPWDGPIGMTPVESMACGTPVIGSALDGSDATMREGVTGFLVPPRTPRAITERLSDAFADRRWLRRMGGAAAHQVRPSRTWRRITEQLVGIYAAAIVARGAATEPAIAAGGGGLLDAS